MVGQERNTPRPKLRRSDSMNMLEHALEYAAHGWAVIPLQGIDGGQCTCAKVDCSSPGKHPIPSNGSKAATIDVAEIRAWWAAHPNANIGIATGAKSGIIVIDVDHGPDKSGYASLEALQTENGIIPQQMCVRTGSGGLHIYLSAPGQEIRNSASALAPNIDVRGEGGYVVAPPSLHLSGKLYVWENTYGV